ncbi:MAG: B12-binding domain-containing radical SAM protein, partial [Pseudomonadota bacterium]
MDFPPESLQRFQKPSRYIGREVGAVIKDDALVDLHLALAFPDVYEIGMSHVGLRILYGLINQQANFWAERVMAPWTDLQEAMQRSGWPLTSLESGRALADFDVIGFSLQYELSYTNILHMLDLGRVPLSAAERGPGSPLVIGGGPGAFNPEPVADFFDFFYLGEAEAGLLEILSDVAEWKKAGGSRAELLYHLAGRPGIYVPSLFQPVYGPDGRLLEIKPLKPGYEKAVRVIVPDLDGA